MSTATESIVPPGRLTRMYAEKVLSGIKPEQFARKPKGVDANHPAWVVGHLAIYPERVLEMLDRKDLVKPFPWNEKLFDAASKCEDDPNGTIYPPMEEMTSRLYESMDRLLGALAEADDKALGRQNPSEKMRDMIPTVGGMASFLVGPHPMMHFGQVSTWRRAMGYGPCM